jgi:hypothetical protein
MSTPTYSWDTVINSLTQAIQAILTELGNALTSNAQIISRAIIGISIAVGVGYAIYRAMPIVSRFLRSFRL